MWCPKCKNEYRPGFTHCPDCDVDLVESLDKVNGSGNTAAEEFDVDDPDMDPGFTLSEDEEAGEYEYGDDPDEPDMRIPKEALIEGEDGEIMIDGNVLMEMAAAAQIDPGDDDIMPVKAYESSRQKAEDNRSSAFALLLVGVIGCVAVVLLMLDMLPIRLAGMSKYLIGSVMGFLFVVFVFMGISSFKASKKLLQKADEEDELINKAREFMDQEITAEKIDKRLSSDLSGQDKEQRYFARIELIRKSFSQAFPDMDEALSEKLIDDRYTEIYDED